MVVPLLYILLLTLTCSAISVQDPLLENELSEFQHMKENEGDSSKFGRLAKIENLEHPEFSSTNEDDKAKEKRSNKFFAIKKNLYRFLFNRNYLTGMYGKRFSHFYPRNQKFGIQRFVADPVGSEFLGKRGVLGSEFLGKRAIGSEFLGKRAMGSEFLGKRAMGSEFLGKRIMGSEFLGKRAKESEILGKRAMGSEFLGKRVMGSEFLGKRAMGSEFLGKRVMGSEFLGKRAMGSEFLGKRVMGSEFLGKRVMGSEFLGKKRVMGSEFLGKRVPTNEVESKSLVNPTYFSSSLSNFPLPTRENEDYISDRYAA